MVPRKLCTVCSGREEISHVSDDEMKLVMKSAANAPYNLLWRRENDPVAYNETWRWDAATPRIGMTPNSRSP